MRVYTCASGDWARTTPASRVSSTRNSYVTDNVTEATTTTIVYSQDIHKLTCMVYGYLPLSPLYVSLSIIPISRFGFQNQVMLTAQ
jgi:hypothetical protein